MSSTGDNIGMMEGAFFVGRKAILDWLNEFLSLNLGKIEETCTGAIACQLCDSLYPGKVNMSKVRWDAKADFEYVQNYKVLQDCFKKVGISKHIPVQLLIRGKYQDNLEFMQWMKRFFELNDSGEAYNAVERRSKGKGGKTYTGLGKVQKKTTSREKRDRFINAAKTKPKTKVTSSPSSTTTEKSSSSIAEGKMAEGNENRRSSNRAGDARSRPNQQRRRPAASTTTTKTNGEVIALREKVTTVQAENDGLQKEKADLQLTVDGLEKERDFYFGKLRDIEILLQTVDEDESEDAVPEKQLKLLIERGLKILYATEGEDFVAVTELVDAAAEPEDLVVDAPATEVVVPPSPTEGKQSESKVQNDSVQMIETF